MKKGLRIICVILIAVMICAPLCGCQAIDRLRERQVIRIDEETLKLEDTEYKRLPPNKYFEPIFTGDDYLNVTDSDVPVLLSEFFGQIYYRSSDGRFIIESNSEVDICYVVAEDYDEVKAKIENGFELESYCYNYYNAVTGENEYYLFSDAEYNAVNEVLKNVTPVVMPNIAILDYDDIVCLEVCSKDLLFRDSSYDIALKGENYYIVDYDDSSVYLYEVPEAQKPEIKQIMEDFHNKEAYIIQETTEEF